MTCNHCKSEIVDGVRFCPVCGTSTQQFNSTCSNCGSLVESNDKFCSKCGMQVGTANTVFQQPTTVYPNSATRVGNVGTSGKTANSFWVSILSAVISFIIRIAGQGTHYSYENIMNNRKVLGLDGDMKPIFTIIPVIAVIIVSLLIVSDQKTSSHKKAEAFIINAVFIALSLLFIWFDIPSNILDF